MVEKDYKGERVLEILGKNQESVAAEIWPGATVETQALNRAKARGKFEHILAAHVLQQVPRFEVVPTLERWGSWLNDEGELHITVPDLMWVCEMAAGEHEIDSVLLGVLYGAGELEHRSGFTVLTLRGALAAAGLISTRAQAGPYTLLRKEGEEVKETIARQILVVARRRGE